MSSRPPALDRLLARVARLGALRRRLPELAIVAVGLFVRASMWFTFDPRHGYDFAEHWKYVAWFRTSWTVPPLMFCRETYHPPLYYFLAGMFGRRTRFLADYTLPSIICGCLTLLLLWWGLERHLPGRRLARLFALALAAVLPSSIHVAGMVTGEALNGLLALAALLLAASILQRKRERVVGRALLLGLVLGLELLTKISALVIAAAIAVVAALDAWWHFDDLRALARRAAPWLLTLAVFLATAGWYFGRNQALYGKAFLTGWDGTDGAPPAELEAKPYLDRRPLGFLLGWTNHAVRYPYYPSGVTPASRFWPVMLTSTFVDYYDYGFIKPVPHSSLIGNFRYLPPESLKFARASAAGGVLVALTTVLAWLLVVRRVWRGRDAPRLLLLLAPAVALAGQLHFALRYAMDYQGPIKGAYLQFACAPLIALFGLGVAWLAGRRWGRALVLAELVALVGIASYTAYARWPDAASVHRYALEVQGGPAERVGTNVAGALGREARLPDLEGLRAPRHLAERRSVGAHLDGERDGALAATVTAVDDRHRGERLQPAQIDLDPG